MLRRALMGCLFSCVLVLAGPLVDSVQACPNCKEGLATQDNSPQAYQYSIIFMLAMPATIFTGFSIGFYRLSRRAAKRRENIDAQWIVQCDDHVATAVDQANDQPQG